MTEPWKRKEVIGDCTLYLGDCLEVLPALPRKAIVVSDPPYGIAYKSPSGRGKTVRGDYAVIAGDDKPFDPAPWLGWDQVCLFGGNHFADRLPPSAKWLVWDKRAGMTPNNNSDCELAWVKKGGSARLITHLWNGMLKASERDELRVHPTQKPVVVMEWAISQCDDGGTSTVIDPYMGSGATGVACVRQKRAFIGIEIDPAYFAAAVDRIRRAYAEPDMFTAAPQPEQLSILDEAS
jgi:site-specific DNA-methyltransferase (adenine-specific)